MKKGLWKNEEVVDLFKEVELIKNKNKSLKYAFIEHGKKYNRQPNSVRNYYYHEIDNLKEDKKRLKELKIDLSKHEKNEIQYFSEEEENLLMRKIDEMAQKGVSVRKACLELSNGNVELMLRFQNKYRNFIAKRKVKAKEENNIIKFKKKNIFTDSEMNALFMGIVKLVKKNAFEEAKENYEKDLNMANIELRKSIMLTAQKEKELLSLKEELAKIKEENMKLIDDIIKLRSEKAEKLKNKLQTENLKQRKLLTKKQA